jgi:5-formyltetrahydrofolate cyclo-ligase
MPPVEPDDTRGPALREAKLALRARILLARDALSPAECTARSAAIVARIEALPSFARAQTLLLTVSFRSEWDTLPLISRALTTGRTVILPRVDPRARMLELCRIADLERDIAPGYYGIPEPLPTLTHVAPDEIGFVLVPGVAFDRSGRRLGYGGGFYDRLLPLLPSHAPRVAGAYAFQIVSHVPAAAHDITMDAIVTDEETIAVRGAI